MVRDEAQTIKPMPGMSRFPALDGWRAVSILLVMSGHLLPLGPKAYQLNGSAAAFGMAIFFTLSGFLITTTLLHRPSVSEFLIRRLCWVVPIAWLFTIIALTVVQPPASFYCAHLFFYANLPPSSLTEHTGHLWSLCVEMQFYVAIAVIVLAIGRRGLWSIPLLCLVVTANRIQQHELSSIVTSLRVDEILAGGILALVCNTPNFSVIRRFLTWANPIALLPFAFAASNILSGPFCYSRPYLVAAMVGSTLLYTEKTAVTHYLEKSWLAYVAAISYALYILHPVVDWGWLASGSKTIKYAKRIPELAAVFGLAHLSTFYFEDYWIRKGKLWSKNLAGIRAATS